MDAQPATRIWLASLDDAADTAIDAGVDWLSDDEGTRLQAMTSDVRRRSFLAGHWQARVLAAGWLQVHARRIALHRHDDGRPCLSVDGDPSALSLSLSHSGDWLAIALATVPVGIDVELPRRPRDLQALARFTFSPEDPAAQLERLQKLLVNCRDNGRKIESVNLIPKKYTPVHFVLAAAQEPTPSPTRKKNSR